MQRKKDVVDDFNGRKIVFIHDIIFKKKKYAEFAEALEDYDEDEMSAVDAAYYLEVTNRVNQKMLESL